MEKKKKIVHILGKGDGWDEIKEVISREEKPEIYGINDSFLRTPEVTKTFHLHDMEAFLKDPKTHSSTALCIERANAKPEMDFYTIYRWKEIPHSKEYPLDEIAERFKTSYFTSTIEYAIAFALWEGVDEIYLYGINMTVKQEYIDQKPGCEYWLGIANGLGVDVHLQHQNTSLLKTRNGLIYGWNTKQWRP